MSVVPELDIAGGGVRHEASQQNPRAGLLARKSAADGGGSESLRVAALPDGTFARPILAAIMVAWALYAMLFIYLSSAVVSGTRYFMLFDDEMISMRYAANLVHGYGLVWNPHGAHVEGFTNPLWVFIMVVFHLLPLSLAKMSLLVQLLAAGLGMVNLLIVWRLANSVSGSKSASLVAVFLTAAYFPLNQWALRGTEVALLTPLLSLAALQAIETIEGGSPRWLWPLLAIGTLTRLDLTAPALVIIAMVAFYDRGRRREHLIKGLGWLLVFLGAQLILNRWYYGSALPNTYYLKVTGFPVWLRLYNGLLRASTFLRGIGAVLLLLTAAIVWLRRDAKVLIPLAVFAGQIAYSIWVGGDAWEEYGGANRFVAVAMPLFIVLLATALTATSVALNDLLIPSLTGAARKWKETGLLVALSLLSIIILGSSSKATAREMLLLDPPDETGHLDHLKWALTLDQLTDRNAKVAVTWAGIIPYFADRSGVDLLGRCNATIAHEPMHLDPKGGFYPGHMKWDYDYSIGRLKPDVVVELFRPTQEEVHRDLDPSYTYATIDGQLMFFRGDSNHVLWDQVYKLRSVAR
jgi:hypothetical protein